MRPQNSQQPLLIWISLYRTQSAPIQAKNTVTAGALPGEGKSALQPSREQQAVAPSPQRLEGSLIVAVDCGSEVSGKKHKFFFFLLTHLFAIICITVVPRVDITYHDEGNQQSVGTKNLHLLVYTPSPKANGVALSQHPQPRVLSLGLPSITKHCPACRRESRRSIRSTPTWKRSKRCERECRP